MAIENEFIAIGIAALSFLSAIIIAVMNRENEHRLTKLEENVPTKADLDNLKDVCFKTNMIWSFYEKQLPLLLKNPPYMDGLLLKASLGIKFLDKEELIKLKDYLHEQIKTEDTGRQLMASLYLQVVEVSTGGN